MLFSFSIKVIDSVVKILDKPGIFCLFSSFSQYNDKYSAID